MRLKKLFIKDIEKQTVKITFGNNELIFSGLNALYWPQRQLVVVSDLHLEKGSYYAKQGNPLPLYDTLDTLLRLKQIIELFKPKSVITLGDNIHDYHAVSRMNETTKDLLGCITQDVKEWIWIMGNHDQNAMPDFKGNVQCYPCLDLGNITFSHDFLENSLFQIVGHYHPKLRVKNISGKCFLLNKNKIIMPSFGSYTGGFNIESERFKQATNNEIFQAFLLNKNKIWRVK